jgi:hypothetical protein
MTIEGKHTNRGFRIYEGTDRYGDSYSLQQSSLATEDCVWLGQHPVAIMQEGWHPKFPARARELPEEDRERLRLYATGRMHLTREMVAELIPLLQHFVETGELPPIPAN